MQTTDGAVSSPASELLFGVDELDFSPNGGTVLGLKIPKGGPAHLWWERECARRQLEKEQSE